MRVVVATNLLVVLVVVVTLVHSSADLASGVVGATAGGSGLACNESAGLDGFDLGSDRHWGGDGSGCEEQGAGDEGETHNGNEKDQRFGVSKTMDCGSVE